MIKAKLQGQHHAFAERENIEDFEEVLTKINKQMLSMRLRDERIQKMNCSAFSVAEIINELENSLTSATDHSKTNKQVKNFYQLRKDIFQSRQKIASEPLSNSAYNHNIKLKSIREVFSNNQPSIKEDRKGSNLLRSSSQSDLHSLIPAKHNIKQEDKKPKNKFIESTEYSNILLQLKTQGNNLLCESNSSCQRITQSKEEQKEENQTPKFGLQVIEEVKDEICQLQLSRIEPQNDSQFIEKSLYNNFFMPKKKKACMPQVSINPYFAKCAAKQKIQQLAKHSKI